MGRNLERSVLGWYGRFCSGGPWPGPLCECLRLDGVSTVLAWFARASPPGGWSPDSVRSSSDIVHVGVHADRRAAFVLVFASVFVFPYPVNDHWSVSPTTTKVCVHRG